MKKIIKSITTATCIGILSAGLVTTSFAVSTELEGLNALEVKEQKSEQVAQRSVPYDYNADSYDSDYKSYDYTSYAVPCSDSMTLQAKLDAHPACSKDL